MVPGQPFSVGVELTVPSGWHTYWSNPGETGLAPEISWQKPQGVTPVSLAFPVPQRFEEEGIVSFGYKGKVRLLAEFDSDAFLSADPLHLEAQIEWMICKEVCLPVQSSARVTLEVNPSAAGFLEDAPTTAWRDRMPRETATTWEVSARRERGGLRLHIVPAASETSPSSQEWPSMQVMPASGAGIDLSVAPSWEPDGPAWTVWLAPGVQPLESGDRLEAVLVSGQGDWKGWRIAAEIE